MNYGRAIRIARTAFGLTQGELAARVSVGASHLSLIESGKRQPSLKVLNEIAAALEARCEPCSIGVRVTGGAPSAL